MSNDLAIAAVTATVRDLIDAALPRRSPPPVGSATVTTLRPDRLAELPGPAVNLFLYGVSPNTGRGLTDLPAHRPDGTVAQPPLVALDLHYLVSAYGTDEHLDAQRLLARAMLALARDPVLSPRLVAAALAHQARGDGLGFLAEADLADQIEPVRLTPRMLTVDELARLWSVFGQAPYVLSVAYTASMVLLVADVDAAAALPVRETRFAVASGAPPRLAGLRTDLGGGVSRTGSLVALDGTGLSGGSARVQVGPAVLDPDPTAGGLAFRVDPTVPAGVHAVRVRDRDGGLTNALALTVVPTVSTGTVDAASVTLPVVPAVRAGQRVTVVLSGLDGDPPPARTVRQPPVPEGAAPRDAVVLDRADVPAGRWLVRVRVDGVESVPDLVDGRYGAPVIAVPS